MKTYLEVVKTDGKAVFSSFLNGEVLEPSLEDLKLCLNPEKLLTLDRSLRITHLETFYPPVMEFCKRIYQEQNILLSCGIYITPNENSQCFLYHCDHQHILACQIEGEKRWSFPKVKGQFVREYSVRPELNQQINEGRLTFESTEITLKAKEALYVPYAYSHRAFNDSAAPSVHLTFAEEDITNREVMSFLSQAYLGIEKFDERFFERIDLAEFDAKITHSHELKNLDEAIDNFFTRTKLLKFKFGSRTV